MATDRRFTSKDMLDIAERLEQRDAVFSQLWQIGRASFTDTLPTAAVAFDEVGQCIDLLINPKFWDSLTATQQEFVISHEMLHVILEHGRRAVDANSVNQEANNVAMDVVVNELLLSGFGFKRDDIDPKKQYCWMDTIFPNRKDVLPGQTFEYYLNHLTKQAGGGGGGNGKAGQGMGGNVLDDHSRLKPSDISKMAEKIAERLSDEERQRFSEKLGDEGKSNSQMAGDEAGSFVKRMEAPSRKAKRKWESVIKQCLKRLIDDGPEEVWFGTNRRYCALGNQNAVLPHEIDGEGPAKKRAVVYLFLDTSGSCEHLADRFWKLACSIPRNRFDVKFRCFDTRVYEVNLQDRKLYGFGGTSFHILESHIQNEMATNKTQYPDGVFVITDGYGTRVQPQFPKRWHVLFTPSHDKSCFPNAIHAYDLRQFE